MFPEKLQSVIKNKFHFVDQDIDGKDRLFFDNAGGSFRLKSAVARYAEVDSIPDCPERLHARAVQLQKIQEKGVEDAKIIFNAQDGQIYTSLTASGAMFDIIQVISENTSGTNMVTTVLEHPSAFDAVKLYARKTGRELRVARSNPETGGVDVDEVLSYIDQDTSILSIMHASNISGAKFDIENIVRKVREIKPDIFIVIDAVQHAPHALIDLKKTPVDAITIAPYKFFGCRGSGVAWLSPRVAILPHHKLEGRREDVWELGSPVPAHYAVISEIVDYVCWIGSHFSDHVNRRDQFEEGMNAIALHERALLFALLEGVDGVPGLRYIEGITTYLDYHNLTSRELIIAVGFENFSASEIVHDYEKQGVIVYERVASSLYSRRMLESFNLSEVVRVSPLHCHSLEDIKKYLNITIDMMKKLSEKNIS